MWQTYNAVIVSNMHELGLFLVKVMVVMMVGKIKGSKQSSGNLKATPGGLGSAVWGKALASTWDHPMVITETCSAAGHHTWDLMHARNDMSYLPGLLNLVWIKIIPGNTGLYPRTYQTKYLSDILDLVWFAKSFYEIQVIALGIANLCSYGKCQNKNWTI